MAKTIHQALVENQDKLTKLDVAFFSGKIQEGPYRRKREELRANVWKIIKDNNLVDTLKLKSQDINNLLR